MGSFGWASGRWPTTTAALGLYVLYYFGFLLVILATVPALWLASAALAPIVVLDGAAAGGSGPVPALAAHQLAASHVSTSSALAGVAVAPGGSGSMVNYCPLASCCPAQVWPVLILLLFAISAGHCPRSWLRPEGSRRA